jgi:hypothetical protein
MIELNRCSIPLNQLSTHLRGAAYVLSNRDSGLRSEVRGPIQPGILFWHNGPTLIIPLGAYPAWIEQLKVKVSKDYCFVIYEMVLDKKQDYLIKN